jgi:DNA-binding HxlR family transcriptional regulator
MKNIKHRSDCPISFSLDFLGDKWTLLILRDMIIYNKRSYNDFLKSHEKISTNILADRLSAMEENGFISSKTSMEKKSRIIYTMTEKSVDLIPIILEHYIWGSKYNPQGNTDILEELLTNKQAAIERYQNNMRSIIDKI